MSLHDSRRAAHRAFDRLWLSGEGGVACMSRNAAYRWLATVLGLPTELAHIRFLDVEQCDKVVAASDRYVESVLERQRIAKAAWCADNGRRRRPETGIQSRRNPRAKAYQRKRRAA